MTTPPRRKGSLRMADIPLDVLKALNEGREETITLVEWLAIDMPTLLRSISPGVGLGNDARGVEEALEQLARKGITERLRGAGRALEAATRCRPDREQIYERLASHASDMVRAWAAFHVDCGHGIVAGRETCSVSPIRR